MINLPVEIQQLIFHFDNTYHENYQFLVKELQFLFDEIHFFYCHELNMDEMEYPSIICDILLHQFIYPSSERWKSSPSFHLSISYISFGILSIYILLIFLL